MTHRPAKTRLRLRLMTLSAALVALGMVGVPAADAAKKKCKEGKEENGCTLKAGSSFTNTSKTPGVGVNVGDREIIIRVGASNLPGCSSVIYRNRPFGATGKAKVGKSVNVDRKVRLGSTQTTIIEARLKGTVKFNSAQKATVNATFTRLANNVAECSARISVTLKRKGAG